MATHSNILVWEIPWTEEPGRLQSMGSHRVGQQQQVRTEIGPVFLYNIETVCHLPFGYFQVSDIFLLTQFDFERNAFKKDNETYVLLLSIC